MTKYKLGRIAGFSLSAGPPAIYASIALFVVLLGTSQYPPSEPALPADVHIRRALGGPIGSFLVSILAAILALLLQNSGGVSFWLAGFFFLDNFLVFTLGSLLPLGFTDGSTLLHWRKKH